MIGYSFTATCPSCGGELDHRDSTPLDPDHDLACWCPLEDAAGNRVPCHADVLLELANAEPT